MHQYGEVSVACAIENRCYCGYMFGKLQVYGGANQMDLDAAHTKVIGTTIDLVKC